MTKTKENDQLFSGKSRSIWISLIVFRFLITVLGQRGYIHPDEFFQGPEIIAGDVFECKEKVFHAWEFQVEYDEKNGSIHQLPIRNIAIPAIFYGIPFAFLKWLASIGQSASHDGLIQVNAATLIYYPRLLMTLVSFLVDICLYKLANLLGLNQTSLALTFASSYISIVFLTRTFSNSIETLLFTLLIYFVVRSIKSAKFDPNEGKLIGLILN